MEICAFLQDVENCPTCINFYIKGGYHSVASDGEFEVGCLAPVTDFSPLSDLCTPP